MSEPVLLEYSSFHLFSVTCTQSKQVYVVLRSFHFHDLRVDEALRSFLESYRLPGESPVIEHIMEFFSKQFYVSGPTFTCVMTHIQCWILFTCMTSCCKTIDDFFFIYKYDNVRCENSSLNSVKDCKASVHVGFCRNVVFGIFYTKYSWTLLPRSSRETKNSSRWRGYVRDIMKFNHLNSWRDRTRAATLCLFYHLCAGVQIIFRKVIQNHMPTRMLYLRCVMLLLCWTWINTIPTSNSRSRWHVRYSQQSLYDHYCVVVSYSGSRPQWENQSNLGFPKEDIECLLSVIRFFIYI